MRAQSNDVELELQTLRVGLFPEIALQSRSSTPHVIQRGFLTVPTRSPCSGGAEITAFTIDGQTAEILSPGTHSVKALFQDQLNGYTMDVVIDVEMVDGACVRAPVLSQVIPFAPVRRLVLVVGGGADGNTALAGVKASADFHLGVGTIWRSVLLTGQVGAGTAQCVSAVCGPGDGDKARIGPALVGSLAAIRAFPLPGGAWRGSMLTAGARYSFMATRLPALDGNQRLEFHRLQALVGWALGVGFAGPLRHREMTPVLDFAIPIGIMAEQSAFTRVAFVAGVEARFLFDL